jgi:hypothetical protein
MLDSELLTADELAEITGYKAAGSQRAWLADHGWPYVVNAAGRPVVGRWAARLRLAGVQPTAAGVLPASRPNFAALD